MKSTPAFRAVHVQINARSGRGAAGNEWAGIFIDPALTKKRRAGKSERKRNERAELRERIVVISSVCKAADP